MTAAPPVPTSLGPDGPQVGTAVPTARAPVRTRGTRSRAGNAMGRTRDAALTGAAFAVAKYGVRKATMGDIAMLAGIAKATLYNHFRTRDDVYRALVDALVDEAAARALRRAPDGLAAVLDEAAQAITGSAVVQRIARDDPAVLAKVARIGPDGAWATVRAEVARAFVATGAGTAADDPAAVDVVVRYLASQLLAPSGPEQRTGSCALLAAAVTAAAVPAAALPAVPGPGAGSEDTTS